MNRITPIAIVLAATAVSCHHPLEDETASYLEGSLTFDMPQYVTPGQIITVTPSGITLPGTGDEGYAWSISALSIRDTVRTEKGTFSFTMPNEIGTYTILCSAFAADHYSSSASKSFTSVDPAIGGSLQGTGIDAAQPSILRRGDRYYYTRIGSLDWFRNNLSDATAGLAYEDNEAVSYIFGRYYTWDEAATICPPGWRLPTLGEWTALANALLPGGSFQDTDTYTGAAGALMADATFNGNKMWEFWPEVKITNSTSLAAIPAGYAVVDASGEAGRTATFSGLNSYAAFWTRTDAEDDPAKAYYRYINVNKPDIYLGKGDKASFAASVRCVRNP